MPVQFKVLPAAGRTMEIANYLSRHPLQCMSDEIKIKAEDLWNNLLPVNDITQFENVSANQKQ